MSFKLSCQDSSQCQQKAPPSPGCLQIQPNKFPGDFQDTINKFPVDFLHWSSLLSITIIRTMITQALPIFSFSWQLLGRVANPWDHSDPVYPSTSHVFSFSWQLLGAGVYKNYTADYKFFQENQQKSRRFPGGISNSRRFKVFPVFPGVVDTLYRGVPKFEK